MATQFIKRHALATFLVLTFAVTWAGMAVWLRGGRDAIPWFTFAPMLAALLVTSLVAGRDGLKSLLQRQIEWRVGIGWYMVALGLPFAIEFATVALNVALGASTPAWERMRPLPNLVVMFAMYTLASGPLGEELGWRGFALPRLLRRFANHRYGALAASLILGVIHSAWHLPLLLGGEQDVPSLLGPIAAAIVFTWLFQNARGSVLIAVLFHSAVQNSGRFLSPVFAGDDATQQHWLKLAVWAAAALGILVFAGARHLARTRDTGQEQARKPIAAS